MWTLRIWYSFQLVSSISAGYICTRLAMSPADVLIGMGGDTVFAPVGLVIVSLAMGGLAFEAATQLTD